MIRTRIGNALQLVANVLFADHDRSSSFGYARFHCTDFRSIPSCAISYSGESARNRSTTSTTRPITYSTSSSVLNRPSPNRIDVCANSSPTPNAFSTYEGSSVADVQAEPEDSAMSWLTPIRNDSTSTYEKLKCRLPGKRCTGWRLR